jgi:trimeric autotransporter adhesin
MRRFLTLVCLLFLGLPAGITISGCYRNPAGNYCNGQGYGLKITDVYAITLQPSTTGISMAFGQTRQVAAPTAVTCKNTTASVTSYSYGTSNNKLVDISPSGSLCAGTWNRNSGGGIADYTICNYPNPLPDTGGLPYSVAYITASANSVTSNPVAVYVHAQVSSISLVGPQQCLSQNQQAQLDAQACYSSNGQQVLLCAPSSVTQSSSPSLACPLPTVNGTQVPLSSIPSCTSAIGTLTYTAGTGSVASINSITNQITAQQPGTTVITASTSGSGSAAGYFSTCPPRSISVTLNGGTSGSVTQGVVQNLVTQVYDTNTTDCPPLGCPISGLTLDYQSTNPQDISVAAGGAVTASFPGTASVYALCQPGSCNPAPINQIGLYGTGLSISSNPVTITTPGTASAYTWYSAPGYSQYFVPVQLLNGTVGSTVRLPYVPNSMVMDRNGNNLYFGSWHELMIFSTTSNALSKQDPSVPGVVLAVAPNNQLVLINDQVRDVFYLYNPNGTVSSTFGGSNCSPGTVCGGLGASAQWTPDSKTLYITDSSALGGNHTDTLYVYNANTGWTTYSLPPSNGSKGAQSLAIMVPSVGAYVSGNPTVAHTWCPAGNVGAYNSMIFYPQEPSVAGDSVNVQTDLVAATNDGHHILGAALTGSGLTFSDFDVTVPADASGSSNCLPPGASKTAPGTGDPLQPLLLSSTNTQTQVNVNASSVNQIVTSPAAVTSGNSASGNSLSFITYSGTTPASGGAKLPYYTQVAGSSSSFGQLGYIPLLGSASSSIIAPIAGVFSPDNTLFFVSTSGDNLIHFIDTATLTDKYQINLNLPACAPGSDPGCVVTTPINGSVPATAIAVKPRATT